MPRYSFDEANSNLSQLISEATEGADVVIEVGHLTGVRLVPVKMLGKRNFGAYKGKISIDKSFEEPLPDVELCGWNGQ